MQMRHAALTASEANDMGLFDALKTYFIPGAGQSAQPPPTMADALAPAAKSMWQATSLNWGAAWLAGLDTYAKPIVYADDATGWMNAARYSVWASNCIDAREKGVAGVGFEVKRIEKAGTSQEGDDKEMAHPVIDLINRANMKLLKTETSFKAGIARQLSVFGDAYILKVRGTGKVTELYILPAYAVELERDRFTGYVEGYAYKGMVYPLEDVVRLYYPADEDPWIARSPTSTAIASINRYNLADLAQEYIDRNGGRGGGNLAFDASYLNTDIKQFIDSYNAFIGDPRNAGKYASLPPGATLLENTLNSMQMQREDRNRRLKQEIFAAYHVPPAKAGDYSDASVLANADQQDKHFASHYQVPELDMITELLTVDLLWAEWPETKAQGLYIAPCYDDIPALGEDEKLRADIEAMKADRMANLLQGGVISLNEAREALEYEPVKDARADDVLMITGTPQDAAADKPAEAASALNTSSLSTIRQAAQAFAKGEMTEQQAQRMLRMAKPDISAEEMADLLIPPAPVEPEPADAPAPEDEAVVDIGPALEVLTAWSEGTIADEAASVLLQALNFSDAEISELLTETEDDAGDMGDDRMEMDAPDPEDEALTGETDALLSEASGIAGKAFAVKVVDKDGDGMVYDNTPQERPATPDEKPKGKAFKRQKRQMIDAAFKKGKKGGKGKKPVKTDEQKAAEKQAKAEAKRAEQVAQFEEESKQLRDALIALEGKDDPSNLRKRISQQLDKLAARITSLKTGNSSATSQLLNEAGVKAVALPIFDFKGLPAIDADGNALGTIEKIHRQGDHDGLRATPDTPVVVISGKAYMAADVQAVISGVIDG
jgi:hypothetical protein